MESGCDRHWYNIRSMILPLSIRHQNASNSNTFINGDSNHTLKLEYLNGIFYVMTFNWMLSFVILIFEIFNNNIKAIITSITFHIIELYILAIIRMNAFKNKLLFNCKKGIELFCK